MPRKNSETRTREEWQRVVTQESVAIPAAPTSAESHPNTVAKARDRLAPDREQDRHDFVEYARTLGWSPERTAQELGHDVSTVKAWMSRNPELNRRIPSVPFNKMRRLAREKGFDSLGKLRIA